MQPDQESDRGTNHDVDCGADRAEPSPGNPAPELALRASDAERQAVVAALSAATGEGRLTLAEFSDRSARAYAAVTRADLQPLTADLPRSAAVAAPSASAPAAQVTPVGAIKRSGYWRIDRDTVLRTGIGAIKLDLGGAEIAAPEVHLTVQAAIGSVKIWIPEGVTVVVDGHTSLGSRQIEQVSPRGAGPVLHLRVDTRIGSVKIFRQ